jgi:hypothetical protein
MTMILALGSLGVGYAAWTDNIAVNGTVSTGDLDIEIDTSSIWINSDEPGSGNVDDNVFWSLERPRLLNPVWWGDPDQKDVGSTTVSAITPDSVSVTIDNGYPYYYVHLAFVVHNNGSVPFRIWKVEFYTADGQTLVNTVYANSNRYVYLDIAGTSEPDVQIWWGDPPGTQLEYCETEDISFEILVLQPAPQNTALDFTIKMVAIQWDEYLPGPLPTID